MILSRPLRLVLVLAASVAIAACGDAEPDATADADIDAPIVVVDTTAADTLSITDLADLDEPAEADAPDVAATAATPPPPAAAVTANPQMLLGTWQSTQDEAGIVEFVDNQFRELQDYELISSSTYTVSASCGGVPAPVFSFTTVTSSGDTFCYNVITLTELRFEYTLAGGRGNTLSYERVVESAT